VSLRRREWNNWIAVVAREVIHDAVRKEITIVAAMAATPSQVTAAARLVARLVLLGMPGP